MPRTFWLEGLEFGDVDQRVGILALGLDIEEYKKFQENTPAVLVMSEENQELQDRNLSFTKENTLFCLNFVLDAVLRWAL